MNVPLIQRILLASLLSLLLGGCASLRSTNDTAPPASAPWEARQDALNALNRWDLSGRISVTRGDDGWHGSVRWRQNAGDYSIDLIGPLGQGRIDIDGTPMGVRLRTADGRELHAMDVDTLLAESTGLALPISGLFYWIRGLPTANTPSELLGNEAGLLTQLEQGGWSIVFSDYEQIEDLQLPTRITAQQTDLQVKLAIKTWETPT